MTIVAPSDAQAGEAVVRRAAEGDHNAFARLVAMHHESMLRVAFAITGDADAARDAAQSAWSIAWRRLATLRDPLLVRSWLIAIAANEARLAIRKQRRHSVIELSLAISEGRERDPADQIGVVDLQRALRTLKADDRTLLALRFVAGLDSSEIAAHLNLSASGVRSRLARLIGRLREELGRA